MSELAKSHEYRQWISSIKDRVQASQIKAAVSVNREMLALYWFLGEQIIEEQTAGHWGDKFVDQMSKELRTEFPDVKGFSRRNLLYMRKWVTFWQDADALVQQAAAQNQAIVQQVAAQLPATPFQRVFLIPWGHNLLLLDKFKVPADALFYVQKTIENNW